jgi:putative acetyltransferase
VGTLQIRQDDLAGEATRALLALHLSGMHQSSPPGEVFALDVSGLRQPNVTVWTAWDGNSIAGMGALKMLGGGIGEVKSMRTHPDHTRKGVGSALLERIVSEARSRGCHRLSLETGTGPSFDPALALYRKRGFVIGAEFGEYKKSGFSQFLHLNL